MRNLTNFLLFFVFVLCASSCAGRADNIISSSISNTTGWKYNDKKSTSFEVNKNFKTTTPIGMVAIQGGSFVLGEKGESVIVPKNNPQRVITVNSFYMDKYEVSNLNWREYMHWLKLVFGNVAPQLVERAMPDVTVWREELSYNEPYLQNYYEHRAFSDYPVVGVTWEQAMDFCSWRTDRVNELSLIVAGIIEAPDFSQLADYVYTGGEAQPGSIEMEEGSGLDYITKEFVFNTNKYLLDNNYVPISGKTPKTDIYGDERKVNKSDGILFAEYRLPTEAEWEFAAYAPIAGEDGYTIEGRMYPWSGLYARNVTKKEFGKMQANFVRGKGDMMGVSGALNDGAVITAPVNAYYPNDFGLYNMAGNVNEWVLDVYRSTSFNDITEYNSFRGNEYLTPIVIGEDDYGNKKYQLDEYGRIAMMVNEGDDLRDYVDGDETTLIDTDYPLLVDKAGLVNIEEAEQKIDPLDVLAPTVTNRTRVYKGGSWKDRIYWINPSTRRYLEQDQCSSTIGFRCAMSMLGNEAF